MSSWKTCNYLASPHLQWINYYLNSLKHFKLILCVWGFFLCLPMSHKIKWSKTTTCFFGQKDLEGRKGLICLSLLQLLSTSVQEELSRRGGESYPKISSNLNRNGWRDRFQELSKHREKRAMKASFHYWRWIVLTHQAMQQRVLSTGSLTHSPSRAFFCQSMAHCGVAVWGKRHNSVGKLKDKLKAERCLPWILIAATHGKSMPNPYEQCPKGDKDIYTEYLYPFTELERGRDSERNKFYGASGTQNWTP